MERLAEHRERKGGDARVKRVCLLGCGRLGRVIANALLDGAVEGAALAAVLVSSGKRAEHLRRELPCPVVTDIRALLEEWPDYVIEAAAGAAVKEFAVPILEAGADLIVLSTSALGDPAFYRRALAATERYDRRIYLAHGVIGGLDVVEAAAMMGALSTEITKRKFSRGSPESDAALDALADDFRGTAEDARLRYPDQLNVAVSLGLAAGDPRGTGVRVEPGGRVDFTVTCEGAFGRGRFFTELGPDGPALAAWSALAMLRRLTARITF